MHTTGHLSTSFGKSEITITRWVEEFAEFLSPDAQPGVGKTRMFTDSDVEVLALVYELRQRKKTAGEIYAALKKGERGIPPTGREITIITTAQMTTALAAKDQRIRELETDLEQMRERASRAEGREDLLRELLREKEAEIDRLKRGHG